MDPNEALALPAGWQSRPPVMEDLQAVFELLVAFDVADGGAPDTALEDVISEWQRLGFNLGRDALLLFDPDGRLAGYTTIHLQEHWAMIDPTSGVLPEYRPLGLEQALLDWCERRAVQQALEDGRTGMLTLRAVATDRRRDGLFAERGYRPVRWDHRMQVDMPALPPAAEWPPGFRLRTLQPGEADARAVYETVYAAFADLGHIGRPSFESWRILVMERPDYDPTLTFMVEKDGQLAGCAIGYDYGDTGWVRQLAVLSQHRGLGLGKALLLHAFGEFYQRGRRAVGLVVDTQNPTGAPKLYEQVGMRPVQLFVYFLKEIPLPAEG